MFVNGGFVSVGAPLGAREDDDRTDTVLVVSGVRRVGHPWAHAG